MADRFGSLTCVGGVDDAVKAESKRLLGYEISPIELNSMAYILYVMVRGQEIDADALTPRKRKALSGWRKAGYIKGGTCGTSLGITKKFWDAICHLCWLGYVIYEDEIREIKN